MTGMHVIMLVRRVCGGDVTEQACASIHVTYDDDRPFAAPSGYPRIKCQYGVRHVDGIVDGGTCRRQVAGYQHGTVITGTGD
jgi:acyl-CoA thioesterase